jgi:hypothetical protein
MIVSTSTYRHPTQAGLVQLSVYEEPSERYLVTESRSGAETVVATLGVYDRREDALARARDRGHQLNGQRYELVAG